MTNSELIAACRSFATRRDLRDSAPDLAQMVYRRGLKDVAFSHMQKERHYVADGADTKPCSACGHEKPLTEFYAVSKSGRVRGSCKACCDKSSATWRKQNVERSRVIVRASSKRNPQRVRDAAKAKRRRNPHVAAARDMLKRILAITGQKKAGRTEAQMGYTAAQLRDHIASQFEEGMSWGNHGEWHIDHIDPVSSMVSRGIIDPREINALSNLRPLWAYDNLTRPKPRR